MHGYHGNTFRIFQDEVYRKDCLIPISIPKITVLHVPNTGGKGSVKNYMYLIQEVNDP